MMRQFNEVMLGSIELFCLCAESGSFSTAAVKAGLSPPAVSRTIGRLERRLGVKLFIRTTRSMNLTEAGERYFRQCRQALAQLSDAERELAGAQLNPQGTIRISIPTPLGHRYVLPLLPEFRRLYPDVRIIVHLSNRNIDFIGDGYDLAIRMRTPPVSELIARPIANASLMVAATPEYLQRAGRPLTLEELNDHDCIQFLLPSSGQPVPWLFVREGREIEIATMGGISLVEDLLGCVTLALNHGGLLQTYRFIIEEELRQHRLVEVLQTYSGRSRPISLLYPKNAYLPSKLRVFIDFLLANLANKIP
ncbi:MAG: LysR family transcriptional regulator [Gammaproteobacteria bacterium]